MKNVWVIRALVTAAFAIIIGWLAYNTKWVEVEVEDAPHGLAATDEHYSLRQLLQSTGATLEVRTALEPLPPAHVLWDLPNVLISPHSASTVTTENAKITDDIADGEDHACRMGSR